MGKININIRTVLAMGFLLTLSACSGSSTPPSNLPVELSAGQSSNSVDGGTTTEESNTEVTTTEGTTTESTTTEGTTTEGTTTEGTTTEGTTTEGTTTEGTTTEGTTTEGTTTEGTATEGTATEGTATEGTATEGTATEAQNTAPVVSGDPASSVEVGNSYLYTPAITDDAGDNLTLTVENQPLWMVFNATTGSLSGTPVYTDVGTYNDIVIRVTDGKAETIVGPFSISVTMDEVELAVLSGDVSVVSQRSKLEDALINTIDAWSTPANKAYVQIFNLNADGTEKIDGTSLTSIDWDPTHDAARLTTDYGENHRLLVSNSVSREGYDISNKTLGVLGESSARYIALGSNPMRNYRRDPNSLNEQMHQVLKNSIAWLTGRDNIDQAINVVMAHLDQSYYFPDALGTREWFDERLAGLVSYNEQNSCEADALAACITDDVDLLIISNHVASADQIPATVNAVAQAFANGTPVLYMHLDGGRTELSDALLKLFDVRYEGDNYWTRQSFSAFNPLTITGQMPDEVSALRTMVQHFRDDSFVIDWSECDGENCNDSDSLNNQFWTGAKFAKSVLRNLDAHKIDVFKTPDQYRFKKLIALLGDHYRLNASFPMDKQTTPVTQFLQAFYGDNAAYQYRAKVGIWEDAGNFGRTGFSHITPSTRVVNHISKRNFRSTGAYALPGKTVSITRQDSSDVEVKVFVNSLRNGSTHIFANNGYKRPRELDTQAIAIEPGETIQFTHHLGGPIHLAYDANDFPVEVVISNIGEHAYWRSVDDNETFASKLYADDFDWAEIAAPSFEVHSKQTKMIDSLNNDMFGSSGGTPEQLVDATMRYVHNFPHVLAGFKGPGIDVVGEIHQFATTHSIPVATLDKVKHMNADQATCGYGCSGNPYDAYWSFSPIGHGDIHELGHGLERSRFRLTGWPGHSTTNYYSYYTKTQYYKDTGEDPSCQSLSFESIYNILQAGQLQSDPEAYIQANLWAGTAWAEGTLMLIQMMMAAEDMGALSDGWHLLARLHLIERHYQDTVNDDVRWLAARDGLGMGSYSRLDAKNLSKEDWLLIAVSHASGFDFRDYFSAWGHSYSDTASAHLATMSLPAMPVNYYVSSARGYCMGEGFDGNKLPLDGSNAAWPIGE